MKRGSRERIQRALGQGEELEFAVTVGEEREHEEGEPVRTRLVERAQDARLVLVAAPALEEGLRLFAPVAPEVGVEEVDHRPEVAPLLHVHLEQIAQVVDARAREAEQALLLDARRLGVPLRHDEPAEGVAVLAGDLLPDRLAEVVAEADRAVLHRVGEEDPPAVVRHLHVVEVCPAVGLDADGSAKEDVVPLEAEGPHVLPPRDEVRLPRFERALQLLVVREVDVVRDMRSLLTTLVHIPRSPEIEHGALGLAVQGEGAAHADRVGTLEDPVLPGRGGEAEDLRLDRLRGRPKRRLASIPVSASGDMLARSSNAIRISSSQSMSSGAIVTRPAFSASAVAIGPLVSRTRDTRSGSRRKRDWRRVRPFPIGSGPAFHRRGL